MDAPAHPFRSGFQGSAYPLGPRIAAGLAAVLLVTYLVQQARDFLSDGYVLTMAVTAAVVLPVVVVLALVAVAPGTLARPLARRGLDLRDGGHVSALVLLALTVLLVFGIGSLQEGALAFEKSALKDEPTGVGEVTEPGVLVSVAFNLVIFLVPVAAWVVLVGKVPLSRFFGEVGLRWRGAVESFAVGVLVTVGVLLALGALALLVRGVGVEVPENERALAIARSVSVPAAVAIAAGAALSEEVFFRGFLQPRVGLLAQAVLFGVAHLSYFHVLQVVLTLVLGLVLGVLYRRTGNLWAPVAAHFTFNLLMILSVQYAPASGPVA